MNIAMELLRLDRELTSLEFQMEARIFHHDYTEEDIKKFAQTVRKIYDMNDNLRNNIISQQIEKDVV